MTMAARVVVVGASVAAGSFVAQLRADGFTGRVVVIDADPDAPYDRPPLSKEFLAGGAVRPEAPWWAGACELLRGRASALDVGRSAVGVDLPDGGTCTVPADHIVIASGAAPIRLPGQPDGVSELRTAADARRVREFLRPGHRIIIIGAGTVGSELASSVIDAGAAAILLDLASQPLDRFLGGHLGAAATNWISDGGVDLRLETSVYEIARRDGEWAVATDRGTFVGDLVVSAVGTRPVTHWLQGSGIDLTDGVRCDEDGYALGVAGHPVPHVHAIGDVATWRTPYGEHRRREDWTSAGRQGRHLARRLLGLERLPEPELDYFWSHQFGRRIQVLGTPLREAALLTHVDEPEQKAGFHTLEHDARTVAWISINRPREFALAMRDSMRVAR